MRVLTERVTSRCLLGVIRPLGGGRTGRLRIRRRVRVRQWRGAHRALGRQALVQHACRGSVAAGTGPRRRYAERDSSTTRSDHGRTGSVSRVLERAVSSCGCGTGVRGLVGRVRASDVASVGG